jgi:hypothetical protein
MSVADFERQSSGSGASFGETLVRNALVGLLIAVALVALGFAKLTGKTFTESLWKEARQTAHAVVGYAFKY